MIKCLTKVHYAIKSTHLNVYKIIEYENKLENTFDIMARMRFYQRQFPKDFQFLQTLFTQAVQESKIQYFKGS
ncbi:hypothetical protein RO3G_13995 [Rhizopus delemar RA 99-880]|uniref:Uncharacterized protein n=1 Tax=Rhizopus delemar (strain RA 99-880 / ATCC MYA-4621 / FGSC 9543 / NRRL 43880) TaxID=246409 RepID=I1CLF4_RHIO9|nr:hypothetical protein RO3G_13995 [Rhizopus delemar RA 99-880]|eukprot:EIE89284.1 hypothetical protein RO3G_13995 [Rhizopus delemar RA 99-880]